MFVGILVLTEVGVRLTNPHVSKLDLFTKENFDWKVKLNHGQQIFEGDALLGWKLKANLNLVNWDFTTFSTNSQGMRYPQDVKSKHKGNIRIVGLGDSVTFGYRVPTAFTDNPLSYDQSHAPFTKIIEDRLSKANPDKKVEVIPMAVPGYTTFQGRKWLERDIESLKPDLITVLFGWNDTELHKASDKVALPGTRSKFWERDVISRSQALIYANRWIQEGQEKNKEENKQTAPELRVSKDDFISNILAINKLAQKHGSKVIVIGTVLRDTQTNPQAILVSEYRSRLAQAMKENNIPYLQIDELTEANYPNNSTLFGELIHPNHLGHQLMANRLMSFIKKKELLSNINI